MLINVTQEDIDNGVPGSLFSCPVAIAARRAIPGVQYLSVTGNGLILTTVKKRFIFFETFPHFADIIPLPKRVSKFIRNFDIGGATDPYVKPFSFELDI